MGEQTILERASGTDNRLSTENPFQAMTDGRSASTKLFEDTLPGVDAKTPSVKNRDLEKAQVSIRNLYDGPDGDRTSPDGVGTSGSGDVTSLEKRSDAAFPLTSVGGIFDISSSWHDVHGPVYRNLATTWHSDRPKALGQLAIGTGLTAGWLAYTHLVSKGTGAIVPLIAGPASLIAEDLPGIFDSNATSRQRWDHALSAVADIGVTAASLMYLTNGTPKNLVILGAAMSAKILTACLDHDPYWDTHKRE